MTLSVKELSCPSFSTGEKKGNDSLEEELVLGTQMPILIPQLATNPGSPVLQPRWFVEQRDGES